MLRIITHRYTWPAEYVNFLAASVRRNCTLDYEFICYTDDTTGIDSGITIRPLPVPMPSGWEDQAPFNASHWALGCIQRLPMFERVLFPDGDRVIFLDLDTVFCGSLDEIFAYQGPFAILADFYRPGGLQFSFSMWEAGGPATAVWERFCASGGNLDLSDQTWIERAIPKPDIIQDMFPRQFVSWKVDHCRYGIPRGARVIIFHGLPKPHEILTGRLPGLWRGE